MLPVKIYKPSDKNPKVGAAIQFHSSLHGTKKVPVIYINATKQSKPKPSAGSTESPFDWDNKISMMLNVDELGEIGAYIRGMSTKSINLVHKSERDGLKVTVNFTLNKPDTPKAKEYGNWSCALNIKYENGTKDSVPIFLTPGQVYQFLSLIDGTMTKYYFGTKSPRRNDNGYQDQEAVSGSKITN